jgi:opacity protein-like surface antigen
LIPVRDGYYTIPIECSGYFPIPIGTPELQVYMGAGLGMYFGSRFYEYGGASTEIVQRKIGYGIHILSGVEIAVSPALSLRTEIKFRDIQFETVNRFTSFSSLFNGNPIPLDQDALSSRISIDGMTLNLGIAYHF